MSIGNKNLRIQNGTINSALENLANKLASINSIVNATDYNSVFASKIDLKIKTLLSIIKTGLKEKPEQINIELMVVNTRYMNQSIARKKAKNPLVSDELVSLAMEAERMVIELQVLLNEGTNKKAIH